MTEQEQLIQMRLVLLGDIDDESKDSLFKIYLNNAKAIVLNTLFPFDKNKSDIEETNFRLRNWQVRCAIELYNASDRAGVETYQENGFSVTYFASLVSSSLMSELVPKAGCPIVKSEPTTEVTTETTTSGDSDDNEV